MTLAFFREFKMDAKLKSKYKAILKANHKKYINSLEPHLRSTVNLETRFNNLQNKLKAQLRKTDESANSIRNIPTICRLLFGLQEDIARLSFPEYSFCVEKEIINKFLISFLSYRRRTQFDGECEYYGETLLNLYIDLFITLTCAKTPRKIEHKPGFLVNPRTNQLLELDVDLEEFLIAFEFQGESHYREDKEIEKDKLKLSICANNKLILIPVNIYQLKSNRLMTLILNSIKDAIGINEDGVGMAPINCSKLKIHPKHLRSYKKTCQRMYLASTFFQESLLWLDVYAARFRETQTSRNPISSSTEAPRLVEKKATNQSTIYISGLSMYKHLISAIHQNFGIQWLLDDLV